MSTSAAAAAPHPMPLGQAAIITLGVIVVIAGFVALGAWLHVTPLYAGFLLLWAWSALHELSLKALPGALIGALTHQAASVLRAPKAGGDGFAARFSGVKGEVYASAVTGLWVITFLFGAWIYVKYRTYIRIPIEQEEFWKTLGAFELKEQLASIGLGILPLYWLAWRRSHDKSLQPARKWLTLVLALFGWIALLVGHVVNNVRGFGS